MNRHSADWLLSKDLPKAKSHPDHMDASLTEKLLKGVYNGLCRQLFHKQ